jgi:ubiquitin C-terminal hydrolase
VGDNLWYCNKCKEHKEASRHLELYKSNKILVIAFKRFNRCRKIKTLIKFPLENFDMGPYLLCNFTPMQPTKISCPSSTISMELSIIMEPWVEVTILPIPKIF